MSWLERLEVGMPVYATDGLLGSIASVPRVDLNDPSAPAEVIVLASRDNAGPGVEEFRRFTRDMIDRIESDAVYLHLPRLKVPRASETVAATLRSLPESGDALRIPLVEEEIDVQKRVVELGHLSVQKKVDELLDERTVQLQHQEVEVEHVPIDQVIDRMIEPYMDGDTFVVPVIEEEVVVTRRLRLKEEVRIRRSVGQRDETLETPYRRERVVIQEQWNDDQLRQDRDADALTAAQPVERRPEDDERTTRLR